MSDFTVPGGAISSRPEDNLDVPAALRTLTKSLGIGFLALSDRTTARLGHRRPWIIGGVIGAAAMLAFLANAPSLVALALGWIFFTICINCTQAAMFTLIADKVPPQQRATVSAFTGLSAPIGIALGSALVGRILKTPQAGYYTQAALLLVVVLLFTLVLREEQLARGVMPPLRLRSFLAGFWINPAKHADFGWAWLTRFLLILSYACGTGFLLFFLQDAVHYEQIFHGQRAAQGVSTFQLLLTLFLLAAIFSLLASALIPRIKSVQ